MRTVIVGAGQAGRRTAELLRTLDAAREIVLIGEEAHPPYDRPPLSKEILLGNAAPRSLMQRDVAVYEEQRIALRLGERVTSLDLAASRVETDGGDRIAYDALVIATGASARRLTIPRASDPRVVTLRSIADARALRDRLQPGLRIAIVGAGLIGLEVAAAAVQVGCMVTVLEMAERAMMRCVPRAISARIAGWHSEAGVIMHFGCPLHAVAPGRERLRLTTGHGDLDADLVLVAIGTVPNIELALAAGLDVDRGILTDACGRASQAHVYAAGEVAQVWQPDLRRHVRFETWQVAQHQPVAVAAALCGTERPYAEIPWHWTDQYRHNVQMFGAQGDDLEWLMREDGERLTSLGIDRDGRVRGAVLIDNGREATPVRRLIGAARCVDRQMLLEPSVSLRQLC